MEVYVTYDEINAERAKLQQLYGYGTPGYKKEMALSSRMIEIEQKYVSAYRECPQSVLDYLGESILNLDVKKAAQLVATDPEDPNVMKSVQCIADTMFVTVGQGHNFTPQERMRLHLGKILNQIGDNSAYGIVFSAKYDNELPMVIKAPRTDNSNIDLLHEMVIGTVMNNFRVSIPNFTYTYGLTTSDNPVVDPTSKDRRALSFVRNDNSMGSYYKLFIEYLTGNSFEKFITTCTGAECKRMLMQIMYALEIAQAEVEFTHHDLHSQNVLISDPHEMKVFQYQRPNGQSRYITTDRTASILDYGLSHVKYKGVDYGSYNGTSGNMNNYHPLNDAFRLVGFLAYNANSKPVAHREVRDVLQQAWSLFDYEDEYPQVLLKFRNQIFNYVVPVMESVEVFSSYIDRLEQLWPELTLPPAVIPPLIRLPLDQILYQEGLTTVVLPHDLISCYYLLEYLSDHGKQTDAQNLFNYYIAQPGYRNQLSQIIGFINDKIDRITEDIDRLRTGANNIIVRKYLLIYLRTLSAINDVITYIKVLLIFDNSNEITLRNRIEQLSHQLKEVTWSRLTGIRNSYNNGDYNSDQWFQTNFPAIEAIIFV